MRKIKVLYKKHEEVILYLFVGGLTTFVSFLSYILFARGLSLNYQIANVFSWICAVSFAFVMNKWFVFKSKSKEKKVVLKESFEFVKYRVLSLLIDILLMYLLIGLFKVNDLISKFIVQFIIVALNYFFSKFLIFKKKGSTKLRNGEM